MQGGFHALKMGPTSRTLELPGVYSFRGTYEAANETKSTAPARRGKNGLEEDIDRVIQMAWEDRTPFEAIEWQFGLKENDVRRSCGGS